MYETALYPPGLKSHYAGLLLRNLMGKPKAMGYETSDEPILAMKVMPMTHRTCIDGYRGRLYEDKT